MRGLTVLALLALTPRAAAIVITQTTSISGTTTSPWAGVLFTASPALSPAGDGPLTSVAIGLTVTGTVTLLEANALQIPGATWTPGVTLNGTLGGTGPFFLTGLQGSASGPTVTLPPVGQFASWTGTVTQSFSALLTGPSALAAWAGAGTGTLAYSGQFFAFESFGSYAGDFTATFSVTYNHVPDGGSTALLLGAGIGLCLLIHRQSKRSFVA